jgi:phosphorylcholine metabolism protein LicD
MTQEAILLELKELLDKNNISFWLQSGTLLGAYRDNNFIKWDNADIDLGLLSEDYWKVRQILENSDFKYKRIWRKELAIYRENEVIPHIDLFFYDINAKYCYCYSYAPNSVNGRWDVEWRVKIKSSIIFPLKQFKFLNTLFNIPRAAEKYLTLLYGEDWKCPNPKWKIDYNTLKDHDYKSIAIIIPTFLRTNKLTTEIQSIQKYLDSNKYKIYVGNQESDDLLNSDFYQNLIKNGHSIYTLPFDCGLSYARNYLVSQTKEPLILILDDDFEFCENTKLDIFEDILSETEHIGCVGGTLSNRTPYNHNLLYDKINKKIYYINSKHEQLKTIKTYINKQYTYCYSDSILNFFLAKRELFNDIRWDNNLKLCEHTDFFLRLKETKWKVTYTSDVATNHQIVSNSTEYTNFRSNINKNLGLKTFIKKYELKNVKDIITINQVKEDMNVTMQPELSVKLSATSNKSIESNTMFVEILNYLTQNNVVYALAEQSCLEVVKFHRLTSSPLQLYIKDKQHNMVLTETFKDYVKIEPYNLTKVKKINIDIGDVVVPFPVVRYLVKIFGSNWNV